MAIEQSPAHLDRRGSLATVKVEQRNRRQPGKIVAHHPLLTASWSEDDDRIPLFQGKKQQKQLISGLSQVKRHLVSD